ncbi:hypothetical protein M0R72_16660 [Candidatus Pacearchaeota archaeon]|jgi:hypothetical protein|nr:hypothetical protein [Candidatus Pacearchaeota archaeon]
MMTNRLIATDRGMEWVESQLDGEPVLDEAVEVILSLDELSSDVTYDPLAEDVNDIYKRYQEEYLGSCDPDHLPTFETFVRCWTECWIAGEEFDAS